MVGMESTTNPTTTARKVDLRKRGLLDIEGLRAEVAR